ncbi:MAG: hypothetical protein E4G99_09370 [Anaerolineales bacterium]|nr:MAG: hypothetical protein E4G99_09370 [Anaerolineales bacterium]
MIPGLKILAGAAILFFGRKLYWFTIAAVGFFAALELASAFFEGQTAWLAVVLALLVGGIGAALAITLQRLAISLAGFVLGGYLLIQIVNLFDFQLAGWAWLIFILGGLLGAALLAALFEWTLILLSVTLGSILIIQSALIPEASRLLIFLLAFLLGLGVQVYIRGFEKRRNTK